MTSAVGARRRGREGACRVLLAVSVSATLGVAGALVIAAITQWRMLASTPLFVRALDPDSVFEHGLEALGLELEDEPGLVAVRGGPLTLDRYDVERILATAFDPSRFQLEAAEVHARIMDFLLAFPRDSTLWVSIEEERAPLATGAALYLRRRIENLPECGVLDDLRTLFRGLRQKVFEDRTAEEFASGLPWCEPPGSVKSALVRGVNRELAEFAATGPDSVKLFTIGASDSTAAEWAWTVRRAGRAAGSPAVLALLAIAAVVFGLDGAGRRGRRAPRAWQPLAWCGATLVGLGVFWIANAPSVSGPAVPIGAGQGATGAAGAWADLAAYSIRALVRTTGRAWIAVGAPVTLAAFVWRWSDRRRRRPTLRQTG